MLVQLRKVYQGVIYCNWHRMMSLEVGESLQESPGANSHAEAGDHPKLHGAEATPGLRAR